ncbi:MAG TPA: glycosyltransferase family 39 protein, partial [Polyangia bacterium]|nr:glycosyltransferase family 39 protein [Polyangia bacterium]
MANAAPHRPGQHRRGPSIALYATAGVFLARLPVLPHREFDADEFEHAHAAWCFFRGMIPYKDFFEHHTPWYYGLLRPFFRFFAVDSSFDSAMHFLVFGRCLSVALSILSVFLLIRIGRLWQATDRAAEQTHDVGPLAGLLFATQPIFLQKAIEIRPDMLALPFFLGSVWLLLNGVRSGAIKFFVASGLSLGAAIMSTQKMLFVLPGAGVGLAAWSVLAEPAQGRRLAFRLDFSRILSTLLFVLAAMIPGALTWLAFERHQAGHEFITNNFLLNAHWNQVATPQAGKLLLNSGPALLLGLLGAVVFLRRLWLSAPRAWTGFVPLCTAIGLLLGVLVIPVAQRQYYLMPLPLVCLFAANGLIFATGRLPQHRRAIAIAALTILLAVKPAITLWESFVEVN